MQKDEICLSNVIRLGTAQQCNETGYTSALFYDWEKLSKVVRQDMTQQGYKGGNSSAM